MNSPLGITRDLIRKIPYAKDYYKEDHGDSSIDHIATGAIFALLSIIAGMHWAPLYWLYLATWIYHCVFIELILDTWIKKKNSKTFIAHLDYEKSIMTVGGSFIDWPKVWAQVIERTVGFVVVGLIALVLFVIFQFVSVWFK